LTPQRRPMGALESEVLTEIWKQPDGLTPREVLERLDTDLAYTTVMTILNRLWRKGVLDRERAGRAFRYRPLTTEPELFAARMAAALSLANDREATLSRFVGDLSKTDEAVLRRLLAEEL